MGRWGQKPVTPQKGEQVETYVLSTPALEELYAKYGRPGEIAPGIKAERGRDNHRRQQAVVTEEAAAPPPEVRGDIESNLDELDESADGSEGRDENEAEHEHEHDEEDPGDE